MNNKKFSAVARAALMIVIAAFLLAPGALAASKYKVLYKFDGGKQGSEPYAGLIFDSAGNLYGTTGGGGAYAAGTVFKLTPNADGSWSETVIYSFTGGNDGRGPIASLIFDQTGSLYGTTGSGGSFGLGTAFQLTLNSAGTWDETVLHSFSGKDGKYPRGGLVVDRTGNLYGTASYGGGHGAGAVFKLTPNQDGSWTESTLHHFCVPTKGGDRVLGQVKCTDGNSPWAGLVSDPARNLYGTTLAGGAYNHGAVFKLTPNTDGSWTYQVVYSFQAKHGKFPEAGLVFDQVGNLYGTTMWGGGLGREGTVFELTPNADGSWKESVLHRFTGGKDGRAPDTGLAFDQAGNIYGTTSMGGNLSDCAPYGCGVVFKLSPKSAGGWQERVLHNFAGTPSAFPMAGLVVDAAGNLYGTTAGDGKKSFGTVFEITP